MTRKRWQAFTIAVRPTSTGIQLIVSRRRVGKRSVEVARINMGRCDAHRHAIDVLHGCIPAPPKR